MTPARLDLRRGRVTCGSRAVDMATGPAWLILELASARGKLVSANDLIWRRYGGANEPESAYGCLIQWLFQARDLLAGSDLAIIGQPRQGWRLVPAADPRVSMPISCQRLRRPRKELCESMT